VPLFGVVLAAVTLGEVPSALELAGVALMVAGVSAMEVERAGGWRDGGIGSRSLGPALAWTASLFGLGTALCWAVSPILIRQGLRDLPSPLLGVTVGVVAATLAYGLVLPLRGRLRFTREALAWKLAAGVLVAASTWARWVSVSLVPVAVVLALGLLSVPTVLAAAPALAGRQAERVTAPVLAGSALIVAGALAIGAGS
jgi:drug/metabolite transporter (DMT)-like permease